MLKVLGIGVLSTVLMIASFLGADHFKIFHKTEVENDKQPKIETIMTGTMRIPIMSDEKTVGYAILDLQFDFDAAILGAAADKFKDVAVDETFRTVYEAVGLDFKKAKKTDLAGLLKDLGERLNRRLGENVIREVRVKEFMFVPPRKHSS